MDSPVRICPICNKPGSLEKKWTRKKSGKRYDYEVFHHESVAHWVRVGSSSSGRHGKDGISPKLTELLNSTGFRRAIFTLKDVVSEFERELSSLDYNSVRRGLLKLAESGSILVVKREGRVYFINGSKQERLDYIMKRVNITLEDITNEGTFERHYYRIVILNDNKSPLHYIQFRATGDNSRNKIQLSFCSYDLTRREKAVIFFLEDDLQKKRILIEPREPVQSGTERTLSIEYFWPEKGPSYTFTAPTPLDIVQFSLVSRDSHYLTVTRTNAGRTAIEDESFRVASTIRKDGLKIKRFEMKNLPSFAVLKFKWK